MPELKPGFYCLQNKETGELTIGKLFAKVKWKWVLLGDCKVEDHSNIYRIYQIGPRIEWGRGSDD